MKFSTVTALLFISLFANAQGAIYSVDCPKPDSCFLKEVSTGQPSANEPRPQTVTSYKFFRTLTDFDAIVSGIRKQASDELAKGMQQVNTANAMNAVADKIEAVKPKDQPKNNVPEKPK